MTAMHANCRVYCPPIDAALVRTAPWDAPSNQLHELPRLLYCSTCKSPRPQYQCAPTIVMRYCIMCLSDYSTGDLREAHCSRNCFVCPNCLSPLAIEMLSRGKGKAFSFTCPHCLFMYTSQPVLKPQSLHAILRSESTIGQCKEDMFRNFSRKAADPGVTQPQHSQQLMKNLRLSQLHIDSDSIASNSTAAEADEIESRKSSTRLDLLKITSIPHVQAPVQPKPNPLTCKFSLKCSKCLKVLKCPDLGLPMTKTKYKIDCNAIDRLPTILIRSKNGYPTTDEIDVDLLSYEYILCVQNPTKHPLIISISAPSLMPLPSLEMNKTPRARVSIDVHRSVVPTGAGAFIDLIPRSLLSDNTPESRAQKLKLVDAEKGTNWIESSFQIFLTKIEGKSPFHLRVPLHITVEETRGDIHDITDSSEPPSTCTYWTVVDLIPNEPA